MKRSFILITLTLILTFTGNIKAQLVPITGVAVPEMTAVDTALSDFITHWQIPGASLGIVYDQRLVYARGFGYADVDSNKYVYPYSMMRIASVSKTFTGIAAMKLIQDGLLHLTDTAFGPHGILNDTNYTLILDQRYKKITVQQLLQHTSGLVGEGMDDPQYDLYHIAMVMGVAPPATGKTVIKYMLRNKNLDYNPGTQYQYSNLGYNILGRIIEKVTGYPTYEEYYKNEILNQVDATATSIGNDFKDQKLPNEVNYYDMKWDTTYSCYDSITMVPESYGSYHLKTMDAHGGWVTNPTEMLLLLTAADGFPGRTDFLSDSIINIMSTGSAQNPNYGMGWGLGSDGSWKHAGALTTGVCSFIVRQPDGIEYALIFNRLPLDSSNITPSLDSFLTAVTNVIPEALLQVTTWPTHDLFSGINENNTQNIYLSVYPNPCDDAVVVKFFSSEQSEAIISVYNLQGQLLSSSAIPFHQGINKSKIDMKGLPSGMYLIRLVTGSRTQYVKVIKK